MWTVSYTQLDVYKRQAIIELNPSAKIPPEARLMNVFPSTGSPDISELAVMSP